MGRTWLLANAIAAIAKQGADPATSDNWLVEGIVTGIIVAVLIAVIGFVYRGWIFSAIRERGGIYETGRRDQMRRLSSAIRARKSPAVRALMAQAARGTAVNLVGKDGEKIRLDEYIDLLRCSLNGKPRKCTFITTLKPSNWYMGGNLGKRILDYLHLQQDVKRDSQERVDISRYLVLDRLTYDNDPKKDDFIALHKNGNDPNLTMHLYFSDISKVLLGAHKAPLDIAIFEDDNGCKWVIEAIDIVVEDIVKQISDGIEVTVTVRISDDQEEIKNSYLKLLEELRQGRERQT